MGLKLRNESWCHRQYIRYFLQLYTSEYELTGKHVHHTLSLFQCCLSEVSLCCCCYSVCESVTARLARGEWRGRFIRVRAPRHLDPSQWDNVTELFFFL